jgi:sterol desaturase/sphingolipid hydroxylase (fatty acid hydroxylase superfamily)
MRSLTDGDRRASLFALGGGLGMVAGIGLTYRYPDAVAALAGLVLRHHVSIANSETAAVYVTPLFWGMVAAILALEALLPADRAQPVFSRSFVQDAVYFALNMLLRAVVISAYVGLLKAIYDRHLTFLTIQALADWPAPARLALAILLTDFLAWFHHWVRHRVPVLWRLHAVHHSQEHMNLFTDLRYHPAEYLVTVTLVALPMFVFANTLPVTFAYALVLQWYTKLYHANIRTDLGPLRHVLVTPQSHRIHHSILAEHRDRNYGVLLTVWDRLFGTAYLGGGYPRTGIADPTFPRDGARGVLLTLVAQSLHPLRGSAPPPPCQPGGGRLSST